MSQLPVIVVTGPTATGKTALGISIAGELHGEIISADSRVVYRQLNIGTAKPTLEEQQGIFHHMIDVAEPEEQYSAACYRERAFPVLTALQSRQMIPVVVGGTGFYIRALLEDMRFPSVPPDEALRRELNVFADQYGNDCLHRRLAILDPDRAAALHANDRFRIIRALEIITHTGRPVPKPQESGAQNILWLGLTYEDRDLLRRRIDERIDAMVRTGWIDEVEGLLRQYGPAVEALRVTHGYPEWVNYLQGRMSYQEALTQIRINIHQYARRQMTWFRKNPNIHWFSVDRQPWDSIVQQSMALSDF